VITSATDLEGNPRFPGALIVISGIATIAFVIIATIRLWKSAKRGAITLVSSFVILSAFQAIQEIAPSPDGSPIILLMNISKVIYFIAFIWAILKLFKLKDREIIENK